MARSRTCRKISEERMYGTQPIGKPVNRWIDGMIRGDKELLGAAGWEKIDRYMGKCEEEKCRVVRHEIELSYSSSSSSVGGCGSGSSNGGNSGSGGGGSSSSSSSRVVVVVVVVVVTLAVAAVVVVVVVVVEDMFQGAYTYHNLQ